MSSKCLASRKDGTNGRSLYCVVRCLQSIDCIGQLDDSSSYCQLHALNCQLHALSCQLHALGMRSKVRASAINRAEGKPPAINGVEGKPPATGPVHPSWLAKGSRSKPCSQLHHRAAKVSSAMMVKSWHLLHGPVAPLLKSASKAPAAP